MSDMEYDADDMTEDTQDDSFDLDEDIWDDNADLAEDDRMDLSANDSSGIWKNRIWRNCGIPQSEKQILPWYGKWRKAESSTRYFPVILAVSGQAEATAGRQRFISICR